MDCWSLLVRYHIDRTKCHYPLIPLEDLAFSDLVERGIISKEAKGRLFPTTIYPTKDPKPREQLVQELRTAMMKQQEAMTAHLELLLKLIAKTTKLFTPEEEATDKSLLAVRKAFKHDTSYTLLGKAKLSLSESPFLVEETSELPVRWVIHHQPSGPDR